MDILKDVPKDIGNYDNEKQRVNLDIKKNFGSDDESSNPNTKKSPGYFVFPNFGPWAYGTKSGMQMLWIGVEIYPLLGQGTGKRGSSIKPGPLIDTFKFLAPIELQENINHEWQSYDSMKSRMEEIISGSGRDIRDTFGTLGSLWSDGLKNYKFTDVDSDVPFYRVDTPLVYKDTPRREYSFTFELAMYKDINDDVFDPIRKLRSYSSASKGGDKLTAMESSVEISPPHMCRVYTEFNYTPIDLIYVKWGVITSIQPTYKAPYINGYPSHCSLQLTIKDMEPTYRDSFYDNKVSVSTSFPTDPVSKIIANDLGYGRED